MSHKHSNWNLIERDWILYIYFIWSSYVLEHMSIKVLVRLHKTYKKHLRHA